MDWKKSFVTGFLVITVMVGGLAFYIHSIPRQQMQQGQWVMHTHTVLNELVSLSSHLNEMQMAHSNFLQSHNAAEQVAYRRAVTEVHKTLQEIAQLTSDNAAQQARITPLRQNVEAEIAALESAMQQVVPVTVPAETERKEAADIKQDIEAMRNEEQRLLNERVSHWHEAVNRTRLIFMLGALMLYAVLLLLYSMARRDARIQAQMLQIESEATAMQRDIAAEMTKIVAIQQEIIYQRLDLEKAIQVITQHSQSITGANGAVVEMLDKADMVYRAVSGNMSGFKDFRLPAEGSLSGLCIATGHSLRCDDTETDNRVDRDACRKVGARSMIVVPLIQADTRVGVLKVSSSKPHAFTLKHQATLQLMAGVISATLRDAVEAAALKDSHAHLSMSNEMLKSQNAQLESDTDMLKTRVSQDSMTKLKNHHYFKEYVAQEFGRAQRYGNALSVIMLDVDHFKSLNDNFGHPAGDAVLKQLAALLQECVRPSDCVARYGGEEFAVVLPQTPIEGAMETAERIRQKIEQAAWQYRAVTISLGVSGIENHPADANEMVVQADKALYASKMNGRNRVTPFAPARNL